MSVNTRKPQTATVPPCAEIAELDDTVIVPRVARVVGLPQRIPAAPGARVTGPVPSLLRIDRADTVSLLHPRRPVRSLAQAWPGRPVEGYRQERCPVCGIGRLVRAEDVSPGACCAPAGGEAA